VDWGTAELPREDTNIGRGFLWALIDIGESDPLLVIVTHLHHLVPDTQVRQAQVPVILDFWSGSGQTVIMGDLNAEPDSDEIKLIYESGLLDAWLEAGSGSGFTVDADDPNKRIDYIWISSDLETLEVKVIQTEASDHLPVIATLDGQ
jgi:endonuclease/exonuclease/phosphatase family metal-dependent hydrolase